MEHRGCRGNPGSSFLSAGIVYWMQIISNLLPLPFFFFFFITPRNWKKPYINQCILPFTLPANLCLAWYKMLLLLQSGMRDLAITDGKLMLITLKRNLHFSDFPFLFQPTSPGKSHRVKSCLLVLFLSSSGSLCGRGWELTWESLLISVSMLEFVCIFCVFMLQIL